MRIDIEDNIGEIDFALAPSGRGKGLMASAVNLVCLDVMESTPGLKSIMAHVLPENAASLKTVVRAGFRQLGESEVRGIKCVEYVFDAQE